MSHPPLNADFTNPDWMLLGTPFPVQVEALKRSRGRKGYNWFLEQGLGKTTVTLAEFARLYTDGVVEVLIIICPNSLKGVWPKEAASWGQPGLNWLIWSGKPFTNREIEKAYAFVFNYESLLGSGGDQLEKILENNRCMLVFDESQRVKNPTSRVTQRALGHFCKYAVVKRCLSGTPMTNTVMDFWPQLRIAGALEGTNPVSFKRRFVVVGGFKGKQIVSHKNDNTLKKLIAESSFRATKEEWAKGMPEKLYRQVDLTLPPALLEHYRSMMEDFIVMLNEDEAIVVEMAAAKYNKLQQISSGFIIDGDKTHELCSLKDLPKYQALWDTIEANGKDSKTLVFAHFRSTCTRLVEQLSLDLGRKVCHILGGQKDVEEHKALFNSEDGPQVMVLQLAAGKEGHTLLGVPGNMCHTTCYFEGSFNEGDRQQSEDRNHRYGQVNPVLYVDYCSSSIEHMVVGAHIRKKNVIAHLLDNKALLTT